MTLGKNGDKIERKYLSSKIMLYIRILAGGYLLYISYTLLDEFVVSKGAQYAVLFIVLLLFILFGICFIISACQSLNVGRYKGGKLDKDCETNEKNEV